MEQTGTQIAPALTRKQLLALPHLACATSVTVGAERAQIGRTTLYRWMRDDRFRTELERMRDEAVSLAETKLQGLMLQSVFVVEDALHDPATGNRLQAARIAISAANHIQRARQLQHHLDLIDNAITRMKNQQ